ncbi:MAG: hypothetical protein V4722_01710 [Bacteroidota bacterium]
MTDTPEHVKALQLKIWLSKSFEQRLHQMLVDNEALYHFWANVKPVVEKNDHEETKISTRQ